MTFHDLLNAANKLRFVDRHQVPFLSDLEWAVFQGDTMKYLLLHADDDVAERIWDAANGAAPVSVRKIVPGEPASDTVDVLAP